MFKLKTISEDAYSITTENSYNTHQMAFKISKFFLHCPYKHPSIHTLVKPCTTRSSSVKRWWQKITIVEKFSHIF